MNLFIYLVKFILFALGEGGGVLSSNLSMYKIMSLYLLLFAQIFYLSESPKLTNKKNICITDIIQSPQTTKCQAKKSLVGKGVCL